MTDDEIREIFMAAGFTIKPGCDDLKPYVYAAAHELIRRVEARALSVSDGEKERTRCN